MEDLLTAALNEVKEERKRQDKKWGKQRHDMDVWNTILTEESGKLALAINEVRFPNPDFSPQTIRKYLVTVAAVAVAAIEDLQSQE